MECTPHTTKIKMESINKIQNPRKLRGLAIAKTNRIVKDNDSWKVPSQSGAGYYLVKSNGFGATCTCPDHETRKCKCKHIFAVELTITKEVDNYGNETITIQKKTYSQNWSNYDKAQINEKPLFMKLLKDITQNIEEPVDKFGRPKLSSRDLVYSSIMKIYTTFSFRRFMGNIKIAKEKGYIEKEPCYASIGHFLQKRELTPLLVEMVRITSLSV